jgi:glycosyltransferase involved in cell wall biosynthesis
MQYSIIIPVFNRGELVQSSIESVLAQNVKDYEIIVVNDGSTDQTLNLIEKYSRAIKILNQKNSGPEIARNSGAAIAAGKYIMFLDSDDILLPKALETYNQVIKRYNYPPVIIGAMAYFADDRIDIESYRSNEEAIVYKCGDYLKKERSTAISGSNILIENNTFKNGLGIRSSTPNSYHMDNYDMMLRYGIYGPCIIIRKPVTIAYRVHSGNTIKQVKQMINGAIDIIDYERKIGYPGGKKRLIDRYHCIGGMSWFWVTKALKEHAYRSSLKLLYHGFPMIALGCIKNIMTALGIIKHNGQKHILDGHELT